MTMGVVMQTPYHSAAASGFTSANTAGCATSSTTSTAGVTGANSSNNEVAVKVAVRVRPLNNREKLHQHQPCVRIAADTNQIVIGKDRVFAFDHVIPPRATQHELYETCVKSLVHSIFEGYNATVFAYGQTGSGKTFTISGNKQSGSDADLGIIPRAVQTMFEVIAANGLGAASQPQSPPMPLSPIGSNRAASSGAKPTSPASSSPAAKEFCVKVNFIEIYKEELKDLLDGGGGGSAADRKELQIREDESGNTLLSGAHEVVCHTLDDVMSCFDAGQLLRHTGSTLMNEQSSRSHSVFTVSVEQRWSSNAADDTTTTTGAGTVRDSVALYDAHSAAAAAGSCYLGAKFHFVDLAGSERVHRTGNVGDRFKDSIHINSGLLALGNVISALSAAHDASASGVASRMRKSVHIPYRESKITRILKDSLGGNANTLMICCISPSSCNLDESINAVKYASRARHIKNKPIVNMDPQTQRFVEMQSEIQALREELCRQRSSHANSTLAALTDFDDGHGELLRRHQRDQQRLTAACAELEQRLQRSELDADRYRHLVREAHARFRQLSVGGGAVTGAAARKLVDEWLTMCENSDGWTTDTASSRHQQASAAVVGGAAASSPAVDASAATPVGEERSRQQQRIEQLERMLTKAQGDLKSDEEIFMEKEKELATLRDTCAELESKLSVANRYLEASFTKEKEQQELMLQMQMQLDKLMMQQKKRAAAAAAVAATGNGEQAARSSSSNSNNSSKPPSATSDQSTLTKQQLQQKQQSNELDDQQQKQRNARAKTAPAGADEMLPPLAGGAGGRQGRAAAYSSPAVLTLERVMQSFRARSQLLAETIEENDHVLYKHKRFNSTFDIDENEDDNENDQQQQQQLQHQHELDADETDIIDDNDDGDEIEQAHFVRKGTFKVNKQATNKQQQKRREATSDSGKAATDPAVNKATAKTSGKQTTDENRKLGDMSFNLKMKEELIRELVANSKFTNRINMQYQHKIESLQRELAQYHQEIADLQKQLLNQQQQQHTPNAAVSGVSTALTALSATGLQAAAVPSSKVEFELKRKLDVAHVRISELEAKHREASTSRLVSATATAAALPGAVAAEKRAADLELALGKLRQQHEQLARRCKEDAEKKSRLERDFEREQQRLKDLEVRADQQQKMLRKKTEDLAQAQRRLRSGSNSALHQTAAAAAAASTATAACAADESSASSFIVNNNQHWVEQEMERLVHERRQMELFKDELVKREELVHKKELLLREKNELQLKKMRASHATRDSISLVDQKLEAAAAAAAVVKDNTAGMEESHSSLVRQRRQLEERLQKGAVLSAADERRLIEIDEAIEALEIAIDYENDSISTVQDRLKDSLLLANENNTTSEICDNVLRKLSTVPYDETKHLVRKFFQKIIDLKEVEQRKQLENSELLVQLEEQNRVCEQLREALSASANELERKSSRLEKQNKLLTQQLTACTQKIDCLERQCEIYKEKLLKIKNANSIGDDEHNKPTAPTTTTTTTTTSFFLKNSAATSALGSYANSAQANLGAATAVDASAESVTITQELESNSSNSPTSQASGSGGYSVSTSSKNKLIKVSRKDLRKLTDDELARRNQKREAAPSTVINAGSSHLQ